jgi:short-subunit dehydrogenase involved in D-alanine esterification of teichoic acids
VDIKSTFGKIDWELKVNLNSLIKLNLMLLPLFRKSSSGGIVNASSGLAIVPKKSAPVYCASKAAVHIFSQALRYQVEDRHPNLSVFEAI